MSSLGFKTNQEKTTSDKSGPVQNPPASPKLSAKGVSAENSQQTAEKLVLSESDKLNGNNQGPDQPPSKQSPVASSSSEQDGAQPVRRRVKPLCAAAKQPAARASMGAIIKGKFTLKHFHFKTIQARIYLSIYLVKIRNRIVRIVEDFRKSLEV